MKSKGLGDTVEKITTKTGIKPLVKFLFGKDCGCEERKERWNKKFSYYVDCLKQREYNYLKAWYDSGKTNIDVVRRRELIKIYNRVFNRKQKDTSCASCIRQINNDLKRVYNEYESNGT